MSHLPVRRALVRRLPVAAACAALSLGAAAQANPYYLQLQQSFTHDTNLFRERDGQEDSDLISTTGLEVGLDQPISRQRLRARAHVERNRFRDNDHLDNTSYGVGVRADLETVNRISGGLHYNHERNLASFDTYTGSVHLTERNMIRRQDYGARIQYGGMSLLTLEAGYVHRDQKYSADAFQNREQRSDTVQAGVRYRPSDLVGFGLAGRYTRGRIPHYTPTEGDKYKRRDLDLTATWVPTGLSTLNARVSLTSTDHDLAEARDFDGVTGAISWRYQPTGKLTLNLHLVRETNDETGFYLAEPETPDEPPQLATLQETKLIHSARLSATWAATAKIRLTGGVRHVDRNIRVTDGRGNDRTTTAELGASYAITRSILFGCNVGWVQRDTSSGAASVSYDYSSRTASCLARLTLN